MKTKANQRGISMISMLLIAVVVIVIGMMAIRLFPVYYDSYVVSSIFNDVGHEARGKSAAEIRDTIRRRFNINEIDSISVHDIKITPIKDGGSDVSLHYEERVPFLGNLNLVASFDKDVQVSGH